VRSFQTTRDEQGRQSGFSLIELLIVVAIILIIAAIAIPNLLRARLSANEASAASGVREITHAEIAYSMAYPTVGYAPSLTELGSPAGACTASSTSACIIDSNLTLGQKSGYNFLATGILSAGSYNTFVVGAAPTMFSKTGSRDYCAVTDGTLRARTGATGNTPIATVAACSLLSPQ
jgi:prepilin-type N-terminal cleavage/methylation domain-containing protein